jgi:hypothetical protein
MRVTTKGVHCENSQIAPPTASAKEKRDEKIGRANRPADKKGHQSFKQSFIQPAPLLFTQDYQPLWLGGIYRGHSAFLVASGPSFASLDHSFLQRPGVLTMGLNNSVRTFRPTLWICVDDPDHFIRSIWLDPTILKFVPISHADKLVFNSDDWEFMDLRVADCPNVVYFRCNEEFQAKQYLWEDSINWGNNKDYGGGRSVMLAALRILFILGLRRVYLLGVDFKMDATTKYHFEQERSEGSITGNNATYQKLNQWFRELRPLFEEQNFLVFNCNPESRLTVFDFVPFEEAVLHLHAEFDNIDVRTERTKGLYDMTIKDKQTGTGK